MLTRRWRDKAADLKDVLGHAGEAVVSHARATGAHANLSHLVCLAEVRGPLHSHHTHHSWGGGTTHIKAVI